MTLDDVNRVLEETTTAAQEISKLDKEVEALLFEPAKKDKHSKSVYEKFVELFTAAATTQFGSGWAWLVIGADGKLAVTKTANADTPLVHGQKALLTIDVWEHAYYIDFRNMRPKYITTFLESLVNWDFANANLAG